MKITKEMKIGDIVRNDPRAAEILMNFGLGCVGCPSAQAETLEEASQVHGFDVIELVKKLNEGNE